MAYLPPILLNRKQVILNKATGCQLTDVIRAEKTKCFTAFIIM